MTLETYTNKDEQHRSGQGESSPATPVGALAAHVQAMSLDRRWALGLGLAVAAGLSWALFNVQFLGNLVGLTVFSVVLCALALAASFTLSSWQATPALLAMAVVGGLVAAWVSSRPYGGGPSGFPIFVLFAGPQLIVFLLVGTALGRRRGLALGQPHAPSALEARVSLWIAAIGPALVGAFLAGIVYTNVFGGTDVVQVVLLMLYSLTCLVGAWLLRSWAGLIAVPLAYLANATILVALLNSMAVGTPSAGLYLGVLRMEYLLYLVLPAVVLSAIGTAIGMSRAGQRGARLQSHQPALPAT